jgi:hypothetical protein
MHALSIATTRLRPPGPSEITPRASYEGRRDLMKLRPAALPVRPGFWAGATRWRRPAARASWRRCPVPSSVPGA